MIRISFVAAAALASNLAIAESETAEVTAPPGGEIVESQELGWRLVVPEGWTWRWAPDVDGTIVLRITTPGVPSDANSMTPLDTPGQVICMTMHRPNEVAPVRTQEDLNAEMVKLREDTIAQVLDPLTGPVREAAFIELRDVGGITVAAHVFPLVVDTSAARMGAIALFSRPEFRSGLICSAAFTYSDSLAAEPELQTFGGVVRSFEPH